MIVIEIIAYAVIAMVFAYLVGRFHYLAHGFPPMLAIFWPFTIPLCLIVNVLWWIGEWGERHSGDGK